MTTRGSEDLIYPSLQRPNWNDDSLKAVEILRKNAEERWVEVHKWYLREKSRKARWSKGLRILAIILGIAGAIIPILSPMIADILDARWGYVLLAAGAGALAFDKAFGFSTAWMRYMRAAMKLIAIRDEWFYEWEREHASAQPIDPRSSLELVERFSRRTNEVLTGETEAWINEFSDQNNALGGSLSTRPPGAK